MTVDFSQRPVPAIAEPPVQWELRSIASMLSDRYPDIRRADVDQLVTGVYSCLSDRARIRAHLIPLTLNRCRQLLSHRSHIDPNIQD